MYFTLDDQILNAAKNIAESLGGDIKKTESELLNRLLRADVESTSVDRDVPAGNLRFYFN